MSAERSVARVRGIEKADADALGALLEVSDSLGIDPDWLAAVIGFESGWDPHATNKFSGAKGAIQFMPSTAARLGYTIAQIDAMPMGAQIRGPVWKYLAGFKGSMKSLDDTYLAVFFPSAMGKSDDYVVGIRDSGTSFQQAVYKQNAGFDSGSTGYVRRGDIVGTIRAVLAASKGKPRVPVPSSVLRRPWLISAGFLAAALIVGAGVAWGAKREFGR